MISLINSGAIIALYLSIFIITKKRKQSEDYFLFIYFVLNALLFITISIAYTFNEEDLLFILINIEMLTTPIWFIYIARLVGEGRKGFFKHFIPYLGSLTILIIYSEVLGDREFSRVIDLPILKQPLILSLISIWEMLVVPFYTILSIRIIHKHKDSIKKVFSYTEGVTLNWLIVFITVHMVGWFFLYLLYWLSVPGHLEIGIGINSFLILYIGFFGIKQVSLSNYTPKNQYSKSSIDTLYIDRYKDKVKSVIEGEKLYLDSELKLSRLSELTDIPNHKLSQVFSLGFKMSFYEFINRYRIEEFKLRALDKGNRDYTLLAIAMDSGFNSKSSFNRIFKEYTKQTPREFLSQKLSV